MRQSFALPGALVACLLAAACDCETPERVAAAATGARSVPTERVDTVAPLEVEPPPTTSADVVFRARLRDPDGAPLAGVSLSATFEHRDGGARRSWGAGEWTTDAQGVLRLELPQRSSEGGGLSAELLMGSQTPPQRLLLRQEAEGRAFTSESGALPQGPWPELVDLGALQMRELPLLIAGRVVGPLGEPVAGARLLLQGTWSEENRRPTNAELELGHLFLDADAQGRFAWHADDPGVEQMSLAAGHPDYVSLEPERIAPGEQQVALRMLRAGHLELSLADGTPEFVARQRVSVSRPGGEFVPDFNGDHLRLNLSGRTELRASGGSRRGLEVFFPQGEALRLGPLAPGRYTVRVRDAQEDVPWRLVQDVEVRAGATTRDPRLQHIGPRMQSVVLQVRDEAGRPLEQGYALYGKSERIEQAALLRDGAVTLTSVGLPLNVILRAPGQAQLVLEGVAADREVRMEPGWSVEVHLPEPIALREGAKLSVVLGDPRAEELLGWMWQSPFRASFDEHGIARVPAPYSGLAPIAIEASLSDGFFGQSTLIGRPGGVERVELHERQAGQRIALPFTADLLDEEYRPD